MEVKAGYKQTEVGVIPAEWRVCRLSQVLAAGPKNGYSGRSAKSASGTPTLTLTATTSGRMVLNDQTVKQLVEILDARSEVFLRANDVLVQRSNTLELVGTTAVFYGPNDVYAYPDLMMRLRFKSAAVGHWFWRYANSSSGRRYFVSVAAGSTGTMPKISGDKLRDMPVPLPPPREQEAIAEALSDADALIESLERLLAKKRQLKQGAMQELLRPKGDWRVEKLESIADVIDPHPSHRAPPAVQNGIPFLGIGDLSEDGEIIGTKIRTVHTSVLDEHSARYDLAEELIGLGRVASIGKVVKLRAAGAKYVVSPTLGVIRGTKVSRSYLLYALKSQAIVDQFARIMSGSTRSSVGMIVLRKLDVGLPAADAEQSAIAAILADMDVEIAALEAKLAKTRQIKQGMMQELLTGRIRLI